MKTFTLYLKKKKKSDNFGIINIRVTENRLSKFISTKISLLERYWNPKKKEVRSTHSDYDSINLRINEKIKEIEELEKSDDGNIEVENDKKSFTKYLKDHIDKLDMLGKRGTHKRMKTALKHLEEFKEDKNINDILFSDIDNKWIEEFDEYLSIKNLAKNTRNSYIKCYQMLYNKSIKNKHFRTYENPFMYYTFKKEKVKREWLEDYHIDHLERVVLERGSIDEETKHLFLFQLYGQGLRVSDLLTLRYNTIYYKGIDCRINFTQFKTRVPHTIQLNENILKHLFFFFDSDKFHNMYYDRKYRLYELSDFLKLSHLMDSEFLNRLKDKREATLPDIIYIARGILQYKDGRNDEMFNKLSKRVEIIYKKLYKEQIKLIYKHSLKHPNKFLVDGINESLFNDVVFESKTILTKKQYNHIESKTAMYNRNLKRLNKYMGSSINCTTHTARHSIANLLLSKGVDVYSISKSLGHTKLSTTESYIAGFNMGKVDSDINKVNVDLRMEKLVGVTVVGGV